MFYRPHKRVYAPSDDTLVTRQSFKNECDIQQILKQYQRTGVITHIAAARPTYMDLPTDLDYQRSMNTMLIAEEAFLALPASVRDRFGNDPQRFLAAFSDKTQEAYLREMGFLREAPQGPPDPVRPPSPEPS